MNIAVLSIFPRMFDALEYGISAQAARKGALALRLWNPRDFTVDAHRSVDDRPYGGGAGMLMKPAPLAAAIDAARRENAGPVAYLSPQGARLDQRMLAELARLPALILLAGRYEGIDERIVQSRVDREISLGDYVLAGGELAAMVLIEGIARLLPGVLGNQDSAREDSFSAAAVAATPTAPTPGESAEICAAAAPSNATTVTPDPAADLLLDHPHYTRPEVFEGRAVPSVLLSGDHAAIRRWRLMQALGRTHERRPELLAGRALNDEQADLLNAYRRGKTHVSETNDD